MALTFRCACGATLRADEDRVHTQVQCPACGRPVLVPAPAEHAETFSSRGGNDLAPNTLPLVPAILIAAAVPIVLMMLLPIVLGASVWTIAFCMWLAALVPVALVIYVLRARNRAFREHRPEIDLFGGFVKLILWDPNEGILLLKNKKIDFIDDDPRDSGGVRFIYPMLGHEVGLRVPLTVQPVEFNDEAVYTRDSVPLSMRVTLWWRIRDLKAYYLSVSQEFHGLDERGRGTTQGEGDATRRVAAASARSQLQAAERWVTMSAEEETRAFVSTISTSLLVAEQIMSQLPAAAAGPGEYQQANTWSDGAAGQDDKLSMYQTATNLLAERLLPRINEKLVPKGIEVDRVSLQEVRLPLEIHQKAIDASKAWYAVLEAQRTGRGEAARLQELAGVIGAETVGKSEMLKNLQGMTLYQLPQFLDDLFQGSGRRGERRLGRDEQRSIADAERTRE